MYPDPMPSTKQQKETVDPRTEAAVVREYLELLETAKKPRGRRTRSYLESRLATIAQQLEGNELSAMQRVELIQERMDCERDLAQLDDTSKLEAAEKAFIEHAGSWAARKGVTYGAFREIGVEPSVLKSAGIKR